MQDVWRRTHLLNSVCEIPTHINQRYSVNPVIWVNTADTNDPLAFRKEEIKREMEKNKMQIESVTRQIKGKQYSDQKEKQKLTDKKKQLKEKGKRLTSDWYNFEYL